jgi:hypothetical protein
MRDTPAIELYACLDISDPMVAWEVAVGRISSGVERTPDGFGISLWTHRLLRSCASNGPSKRLLREFELDQTRERTLPDAVSRLDGLYFFRSEPEALRAIDRWGWSERATFVSRVLFWSTATTVVDSEWITDDLLGDDDHWMPHYWRGEPRGDAPIPEVLARGVGLIDNAELRREAYERMSEDFPLASKLLSFSAAAFWCGCDTAGQVKPGVVITNDGIASSYYIYMRDFESESQLDMAAVIQQCQSDGAVFPYDPACDENGELRLPDFRQCNVAISSGELRRLAIAIHGGAP